MADNDFLKSPVFRDSQARAVPLSNISEFEGMGFREIPVSAMDTKLRGLLRSMDIKKLQKIALGVHSTDDRRAGISADERLKSLSTEKDVLADSVWKNIVLMAPSKGM